MVTLDSDIEDKPPELWCPECAGWAIHEWAKRWSAEHDQRVRLEERLKRAEGERDYWIDKAAELTEMLVQVQEPE